MEICHDYLIYANDDYTKWVTAIGSFKPEMPEDCCEEIQAGGLKFYSGVSSDQKYCCFQANCKGCPEGYSTKMERYGLNRATMDISPGYCFGDFVEKKYRWNNVCEWTGQISQASYAQDYLGGNDLGGSDKYRMIVVGMECSSRNIKMAGHYAKPADCAKRVKAHYGDTIYGADGKIIRAVYFIHSMDGACYVELTNKAAPCTDGGDAFEVDREYKFYMLIEEGRSKDVATVNQPLRLAQRTFCKSSRQEGKGFTLSHDPASCSRQCPGYFMFARADTGHRREGKCFCIYMNNNVGPCNTNGDFLDRHDDFDFYTNDISLLERASA